MQISSKGIDFIKSYENLELEAYLDIAGVPTIGYGHTETVSEEDVKDKKKITEQEALRLLALDIGPVEEFLNKTIKVPLNQNEFDALVSLVFNIGEGAFRFSTLRKYLNMGLRRDAADQFTRWDKATINGVLTRVRGLTRRRTAEKAMFLKKD